MPVTATRGSHGHRVRFRDKLLLFRKKKVGMPEKVAVPKGLVTIISAPHGANAMKYLNPGE